MQISRLPVVYPKFGMGIAEDPKKKELRSTLEPMLPQAMDHLTKALGGKYGPSMTPETIAAGAVLNAYAQLLR